MICWVGLLVLLALSQGSLCKTIPTKELNSRHISNGVIQLIIEAYTEEILRGMAAKRDLQLTFDQAILLRQKLKELYDHIRNHPALHQRYLWVGKGRPDSDPDISRNDEDEKKSSSKRKRYLEDDPTQNNAGTTSTGSANTDTKRSHMSAFPAEEICKTSNQWEQINRTHDFYDTEVEIIQDSVQQFVFTYRCVAETGPCIGISPLYESECTVRHGWMYMYYREVDNEFRTPQWGYVSVPHHCACKITPKYIPES